VRTGRTTSTRRASSHKGSTAGTSAPHPFLLTQCARVQACSPSTSLRWSEQTDLPVSLHSCSQPVGTGFSYSSELRKDIAHDEDTVARDLANFLKELLVKYPNLDRDLYITGESYAGHYEPALAHKLLSFETGFDLKGVLLGNPLIAPKAHYKAYSEFAYDNGLISRFTKRAMDAAFENTCAPAIDKCHEQSSENGTASATAACTAALDVCEAECFMPVSAEAPLHTKHSFNPYDISTPCENGSLCYDFSAIGSFLNKETVKEQLGVSGHDWQEVSQRVHVALSTTDWMQNLEVRKILSVKYSSLMQCRALLGALVSPIEQ